MQKRQHTIDGRRMLDETERRSGGIRNIGILFKYRDMIGGTRCQSYRTHYQCDVARKNRSVGKIR
jgi:hypothetical protein